MIFESATLAMWMAASAVASREREQDTALRRLRTSTSETWMLEDQQTALEEFGTADVLAPEGPGGLVREASQILEQYARILPPVDHEAEAYFDRKTALLHAQEKMTKLTRKV